MELTFFYIIVIVFAIGLALAAIVIRNLIKKVESFEEYKLELEQGIDNYFEIFLAIRNQIAKDLSEIRNIDRRGSFESDDEIGFTFKSLKSIFERLNSLISQNDTSWKNQNSNPDNTSVEK